MKARREEEVVRGSRGNRDFRSLFGGLLDVTGKLKIETYSIDVITFLFRNKTRFCTSVFRVSGVNVP